jgi:GH24 family phage-related lysozyme (muramidase)
MKTSEYGLHLITQREGEILHVYKDSQGYPTAGVGHLLSVAEKQRFPVGTKITQKQSDDWLREDVKEAEDAVNSAVLVPLQQNEFDALVSLTINIGVHGFKTSTIVRRLSAGDKHAAAEAILLWSKPPEIQGRRRTEYKQFKTPYTHGEIPSVAINPAGDIVTPTPAPESGSETPQNAGNGMSAAPNKRIFRRGDFGAMIGQIQNALIAHNISVKVDNDFGPNTERAVRLFQGASGLTADGIVGADTLSALGV